MEALKRLLAKLGQSGIADKIKKGSKEFSEGFKDKALRYTNETMHKNSHAPRDIFPSGLQHVGNLGKALAEQIGHKNLAIAGGSGAVGLGAGAALKDDDEPKKSRKWMD